jgi:1-phosphofructokinase
MSSADWARVCDLAQEQVEENDADWLVVSGVHPQTADTSDYVDMTNLFEAVRARGTRVALDTSGPPLDHWVRSGLVNLIKPNADELANLVGRNLFTIQDAMEAGRELNALGIEIALVSLGVDGALAITADEAHWGRAVATEVINTTGAGDATLAGFLAHSIVEGGARGSGPAALTLADALGYACSWGALAVSLPTTLITSFDTAPASVVSAPEPDRALREPTHLLS